MTTVFRVATIVWWGKTAFKTDVRERTIGVRKKRETCFGGKAMQYGSDRCFLSRKWLNSFQQVELTEKVGRLLSFA